jgi:hypothetical protein
MNEVDGNQRQMGGMEFNDGDFRATDGFTPLEEGARAGNMDVMATLLDRGDRKMKLGQGVLKAAAGNSGNGEEIMTLLLDWQGDQIQITKDVVKAAAGNGGSGNEIMTLLLEQQRDQIQITKDVVVCKGAIIPWPNFLLYK